MLGWEFPPSIAGGLGVACYGLCRALDALGHQITFILPPAVDATASAHARVLSPSSLTTKLGLENAGTSPSPRPQQAHADLGVAFTRDDFQHTRFHALPAMFAHSYATGAAYPRAVIAVSHPVSERAWPLSLEQPRPKHEGDVEPTEFLTAEPYVGNLHEASERYARLVVALLDSLPPEETRFDVIHAHDWLTFPAAIAASALLDRPWIAHVHSTEFDRSGGSPANAIIQQIERRGMQAADRVVTVSQRARDVCVEQYQIEGDRIDVLYNGVGTRDESERSPNALSTHIMGDGPNPADPIVLFLGRVTAQKGPEFFLDAAAKVLQRRPRVRFVLAGSGDLEGPLADQARRLGIEKQVFFTGFLRGGDVDRALRLADCFVMPSVSEPFGLVALEAAQRGVPVIVSRQSGAAEVLRHVLKVDFWDTTDLADKILAVLNRPALAEAMARHGSSDLRHLSWTTSADRCVEIYREVVRNHVEQFASGLIP